MRYGTYVAVGLAVVLGGACSSAWATAVDLELALLVDVSGSVDSGEFNLQKQGYVDAFNSPQIYNAVDNGPNGQIAASLIYWSGENEQQQAVGWTLISDQASSEAFASAIDATTRPYNGQTGIGAALVYGADTFGGNGYEGDRLVMDVSGDGTNNQTTSSSAGRSYALGTVGIDAINGLVIGGSSSVYNHYQNDVIGGTNYFIMQAADFNDFGDAIEDKLFREITNIPEPVTMAGLLMAVGCLGGYIRRRRG